MEACLAHRSHCGYTDRERERERGRKREVGREKECKWERHNMRKSQIERKGKGWKEREMVRENE